jgi:hypothetical protein
MLNENTLDGKAYSLRIWTSILTKCLVDEPLSKHYDTTITVLREGPRITLFKAIKQGKTQKEDLIANVHVR